MSNADRRVVYVTGFGPFRDVTENASWAAVRLLPETGIETELNIRLVIEEVPVAYDHVSNETCERWRALSPHLVVHVGVSSKATDVQLETKANCAGYKGLDVKGCVPIDGKCKRELDEDAFILSGLDLSLVASNVNKLGLPCHVATSENAGRYLCEFIYFTSLCVDRKRVCFIHVPPESICQSTVIASILKACIGEMLKQLNEAVTSDPPVNSSQVQ
ncbi:unnamed protein product [Notodromas monacha]|uniref:Pyroglutamyl-peptidase I n=1 Tax=Notodromas monacha TaxID=399045 RepID=A0A7R9BKA7_9CRUS|nr:unnamed protein product [Notodromas monacha]CAG0915939.1 unnamed protein product [Notodromas monacha]